eukprot:gene14457-5519_t
MPNKEKSAQKSGSIKTKSKKKTLELGNLAIDIEKQKDFEDKVANLPSAEASESGVIYIGHIPHGFYEDEMRKFFSQFGTIKRLRLSRSKNTGTSKGYAFVEFEYEDVAKIAVEAMNNYMMFGRLIKCEIVPKERLHPRIWTGARRKFRKINWAEKSRVKHNKARTPASRAKLVKKLVSKESSKREKLEKLGIEYKFPGYVSIV